MPPVIGTCVSASKNFSVNCTRLMVGLPGRIDDPHQPNRAKGYQAAKANWLAWRCRLLSRKAERSTTQTNSWRIDPMCSTSGCQFANHRRKSLLVLIVLATCAVPHSALAADCNDNGVDDAIDISGGASLDCGNNGIPDECEPEGVCISACDLVVLDEDFEAYAIGSDPADWFDTQAGSATNEDDALYRVTNAGGNQAFFTDSSSTNVHSHYVGPDGATLSSMTYTGRMRISDDNGGIGVTFLSQFSDQPGSTYEYLRLRRANYAPEARTFQLAPPNFDNLVGDIDSGVDPVVDTWYRFRVDVDTTGAQMRIQAKVWEEGQPEPAAYQIDAVDPSGQHPTSGTVGIWSMGGGEKYWDDLHAVSRNALVACDDLDACTVGDVCSNGACEGDPVDCSHLDGICTVGVCNPTTGLCESMPANEGGACDDLDNCTSDDVCSAGVCGGSPVDCSYLDNDCRSGVCNPDDGACQAIAINWGGPCDDSNACTVQDTCAGSVCQGDPIDCSHLDDQCTEGTCNPANGMCEASPIKEDGVCDDANNCTTNDICTNGICAGTEIDCSFLDDVCVAGACNQSDGTCEIVPSNEGGACDDMDICTIDDACQGGSCVGAPVDCSHLDVGCLLGVCDTATGLCELPEELIDCDGNGDPDTCEFFTAHEHQYLLASDSAASGLIGSVATDDDFVVIGAPGGGGTAGAAYVFELVDGSWQEVAKLAGDDATGGDAFGFSVAVSGDTVAVGASVGGGVVSGSGTVYLFREVGGTWQRIAKLEADDAGIGDSFGFSVSIDGDTLIAGAYLDSDIVPAGGSAYIFREVGGTWQQLAKLTAAESIAGLLGRSVALSGNTAVISARSGPAGTSENIGTAYVFREVGGIWQQVAELTADDTETGDNFGGKVAIRDGVAVVSAHLDDDVFNNSGSAYLFQEVGGTWQQVTKFTASDSQESAWFGLELAIHDGLIIFGAPNANEQGAGSGVAYVSRRSGGVWQSPVKFTGANTTIGDRFGSAVAINRQFAFARAPGDNQAGSAYAFALQILDCNTNGVLDQCEIESGTVADCNLNGIPDSCEPYGENSQDCSHLDDDCVVGVCDLEAGTCGVNAINEGGVCSDADNCTTGDACSNGVCLGTPVDCSHLDTDCFEGECNPATGVCGVPLDSSDCDINGIPDECEVLAFPDVQKVAAGAAGDSFGIVAIDGDTAVIGAPRDDDERGSAYVYRLINGTWQQIKKLTADVPSTNDYFGSSVAIGGSTIIVGTPSGSGAVQDSGVAYVFREDGGDWVQIAKLEGNDANEDDGFGTSVAIDGDTVLVGAIYDRDLVPVGGSAYIFREVGGVWQEIAKLTPDDGVVAEFFGSGVAIEGDTAVVGAQLGKTMDSTETGSVYVFREIGGAWQQMTELLADDGMAFDLFGLGLGIDGDFVLVGSPYSGNGGAAYLFEESAGNWQQIRKFTPPDPNSSDDFGTHVVIKGDLMVIGAPGDEENGTGSGAVYVSRRFDGDWIPFQKLTAADGASDDNLGTTVAITNAHVLAGAIGDNSGRGSVYAFELQDLDCNMNDVLDKCDIESGVEADCDLNGIPDVCEPFGENSQDCSHLDDQCVIGICNLENATCSTIPANEGGSCDDLDACSPVDVCAAGICVGMRTDCSSNALPTECPTMLYVDDSATNGLNDGSSWANAYVHLQDALTQAERYCGISEIWVAAGTYRPDEGAWQTPGDHTATFQLFSGLAVYGGFAGTESALEERDIDSNGTILSGDLLGNDVFVECEDTNPDCDAVGGFCRLGRCLFGTPFADNAISVVNGSETDSTAILDGFVIEDGSAPVQAGAEYAGGIAIENGNPMISNCEFRNNVSYFYGGAILSDNSSPLIANCRFIENYADGSGGAIYIRNGSAPLVMDSLFSGNGYSAVVSESSSPTIIGCTFEGGNLDRTRRVVVSFSDVFIDDCEFRNADGGAMSVGGCDFVAMNSRFLGNVATNGISSGGAILLGSSDSTITNCRFEDNYVLSGGGAVGVGSGSTLFQECAFLENESGYIGGALAAIPGAVLTVHSSRFIENTAVEDGGAISNQGITTIANSVFIGNHAGFFGGAIRSNWSSMDTINCTLFGNSANAVGGAWSGSVHLRNSIVWGNTPDQFGNSSSSRADYSIIQGGGAGLSGIRVYDEKPLFVDSNGVDGIAGTQDDNLRLLPGSPAIDRGSLNYLPSEIEFDLDGHDRIVDDPRTPYFSGPFGGTFGILDMGAYEFVLGDCDADGDADLEDHVILDGCLTSPGAALGVGCACLDLDSDGDVDLRDFGFFQMAFIP